MYGGALANMALSMDPFTANRYAFAGGNPISFVELDGHLFGMSWSDIGHAALDVAGLVPVIGEAADVVNGLWYMAEGNYVDGALSMASAIPFAGYAATAAKWGRKGMKAAGAVADSTKAAKKAKRAEAKPKPKADDGVPGEAAQFRAGHPGADGGRYEPGDQRPGRGRLRVGD